MTPKQRELRRRQIDAQMDASLLSAPARPRGGWVQAIREALGMTLDALGGRLGISRQSAHQLERAEVMESITLRRLRTAAEALDCDLIVYLRPRRKLEDIVSDQARAVAREIVARTRHSMAMENQDVAEAHVRQLVEETADLLINRGDSSIWQVR